MRKKDIADEVLSPEPKGESQSVVDAIIADLQPKDANGNPVEQDQKYRVRLMSQWLEFRYPKNSGDIRSIKTGMTEFIFRVNEWQKLHKENALVGVPEPFVKALSFREFVPEDLVNAYILHYWSHPDQPGGRTTEPQALTMVALQPWKVSEVVDAIHEVLNKGSMVFAYGGVF